MKKHFWTIALLFCLVGPETKAHPGFLEQDDARLEIHVSSKNTRQIEDERLKTTQTFQSRAGSIVKRGCQLAAPYIPYIVAGLMISSTGASPLQACGIEGFMETCQDGISSIPGADRFLDRVYGYTNTYCSDLCSTAPNVTEAWRSLDTVMNALPRILSRP